MSGWVGVDGSSSLLTGRAEQTEFEQRVDAGLCSGHGVLFGGWAMGLASEAARVASGQHVRRLATNFLRPVGRDELLRLQVTPYGGSRRLSHCRVDAFTDDALAFTSHAVTGPVGADHDDHRSRTAVSALGGQWLEAPSAPPPESCRPRTYRSRAARSVVDTMDVRVVESAAGAYGSDHAGLLWARLRMDLAEGARLTVLSDHVPYLVHRAMPSARMALTVSASLSVAVGPPTPWVLLQLQLVASDGAYCIGRVTLFSESGALLGSGEQIIRIVTADTTEAVTVAAR